MIIEFSSYWTYLPEWLTALGTILLAAATFRAARIALNMHVPKLRISVVLDESNIVWHNTSESQETDNKDNIFFNIVLTNLCNTALILKHVWWVIDGIKLPIQWLGLDNNRNSFTMSFVNIVVKANDCNLQTISMDRMFALMDDEFDRLRSKCNSIYIMAELAEGQEFTASIPAEIVVKIKERIRFLHSVNTQT